MRSLAIVVLFFPTLLVAAPAASVKLTPVFAGAELEMPLLVTESPNGWYVVEKTGRIKRLPHADRPDSQVVLDLRDRVEAGPTEAGLLGFALHPRFAQNGRAFVSYTAKGKPLLSTIARVTSRDGGATFDKQSATTVLTLAQPYANHNGGQVLFGPDGLLYVGFGDGGAAGDPENRAQNKDVLLGKILRLDIDSQEPYGIPANNPFARGGGQKEIFAYGLRNPWRMSFDKQTGLLWAGDVGQNEWEEIDVVEAGKNYGWRIREGRHCYEPKSCSAAGLTEPVSEYDHTNGDVSVTGGYVYRGTNLPTLVGRYVFGDFASGRIFTIPADPTRVHKPELLLDTDALISSFGEDARGELYVVDFKGAVFRLDKG